MDSATNSSPTNSSPTNSSPSDRTDARLNARLVARLVAFGNALRHHGVVVGTSDVIDAAAIAEALGFEHRERLREGLAAAYLRRGEQRAAFDELFDLFFPAAVGRRLTLADVEGGPSDAPSPTNDTPDAARRRQRASELMRELSQALAGNDNQRLDALAATVVGEFGELNRSGEEGFSANQALEEFQPNLAISRAAELLVNGPESGGSGGGTGSGDGGGGGGNSGGGSWADAASTGWQPPARHDRADRELIRSRVTAFRRRVETEARRRNAEMRGREHQVRYAVTTPLERQEFSQTYRVEAATMRRVIDPLAKKLAARMAAKRRRAAHGQVDVRATMRTAMATGGVPMKPVFKNRPPAKADLVLLCDMSSSVSGFSRFAILLMQAMHAQFGRVRVFGFINTVDELTETVRAVGRDGDLVEALRGNRRMTRGHHNSDYGSTFVDFAANHLPAVTGRATVLILGDARTNNTDPRYDALRTIAQHAHRTIWLNPESESQWGQGDSVAHRYAEIVDMHECRTITDLREFVARTF